MSQGIPSSIKAIKPTFEEISAGKLSENNVRVALDALDTDGIVMLQDVVPHACLDKINERMVKDANTLINLPNPPFNFKKSTGNIQQPPPLEPDLFLADVYFNPFATQVSSAFLGPRPKFTFLSANTALQATSSQPVHTDADFAHPTRPFSLVLNVGLVNMHPENGSTEIWLGTQNLAGVDAQQSVRGDDNDNRTSGQIKSSYIESRQKVSPPFQPVIPKGSLVLRDLRLWHCGKPNLTKDTRVMLALIHFAPWYKNQLRLSLPKSLKPLVDSHQGDLEIPVDYVEGPFDYLADAPYGLSFDLGETEDVKVTA